MKKIKPSGLYGTALFLQSTTALTNPAVAAAGATALLPGLIITKIGEKVLYGQKKRPKSLL